MPITRTRLYHLAVYPYMYCSYMMPKSTPALTMNVTLTFTYIW